MNRRQFIAAGTATGAAVAVLGMSAMQDADIERGPFRLKYAPHSGMFENLAGEDLVDQIKFAADVGFAAWEDNGMPGRPVSDQEKIAETMAKLNMTFGIFTITRDFDNITFASREPEAREKILKDIRNGIEVAKRLNVKWVTVMTGQADPGLEPAYQTVNVIDNLKACAELCEPAGLVMVIEPLNPWSDHPKLFLTKIPQAYLICRAVNSPSCKILDDLYHQQVTEGNLIDNIDTAWSEIGYFQVGDNPGRKEPGTGEINYKNVFRHLHEKGYEGIIGMEHGIAGEGKAGEIALIKAYREVDKF
jgi:hydroxypyruvate isomerase